MAARVSLVALLLAPLLASAEALPDPTRPPLGFDAGGEAMAAVPVGPRLQMIKMSAAGPSAIVDGREVTVGSWVGEMRVVKITEGEVVLKGRTETETLRLFAAVEKRPAGGAAKGGAAKDIDAGASRKAKP
jgi:MSHA biogenesis protein MshK